MIIPPYQSQGHGASLYTALYQHVLSRPEIAELTIEDPSEAFEELRDKADLRMLFTYDEFLKEAYGPGGGDIEKITEESVKEGKLGPVSDKVWVEAWRKKMKIATVSHCLPLINRPISCSISKNFVLC